MSPARERVPLPFGKSVPLHRAHPLRDAILIALAVVFSFVGSAAWIMNLAQRREHVHHRKIIENAAMHAAGAVSPSILADGQSPAPAEQHALRKKLRTLQVEDSAVSRLAILRPEKNNKVVVFDTGPTLSEDDDFPGKGAAASRPGHPEDTAVADHVMATGESHVISSSDGTIRAFAPIKSGDGTVIGIAKAEALRMEEELSSGEIAAYTSMALGLLVAALTGFAVYSARLRSQRTTARLLRSQAADTLLVQTLGEIFYEWDVVQDRRVWRGDTLEILGAAPALMPSTTAEWLSRLHPDDRDEVAALSGRLEDSAVFRLEYRVSLPGGSFVWVLDRGGVLPGTGRETGQVLGALLNITSQKEAEQALIREKEAAQAAVRAKGEFLAMMSHEIRTPLNSVLGFADLLAKSPLDQAQREQLAIIRRSGDALLALLNDILDFSRIESGKLLIEPGPVDVRGVVEEVCELYRSAAAAKGVEMLQRIDDSVPPFVLTDRARLRQILLNLVGNAVKFTDQGSVAVCVFGGANPSGKTTGHYELCCEVRDTGVGIPPDKAGLLFQPFSQVDSSPTRRFGGTGLGLVICRRLAELLDGEIGLRASSGAGSTFFYQSFCRIVDAPSVKPAAPLVARPEVQRRDGDSRILVVEDNAINRMLAQRMLATFQLESDEAGNGEECLRLHEKAAYPFIFMDIQMPILDGLAATRAIREAERLDPSRPRARIIALTADAMIGDRDRCLEAGMDDYLSKPIRTDALTAVLQRCGLI